MRSGPELRAWLEALPPGERDAAFERAFGFDVEVSTAPPGEMLVGHHMLGVDAVLRAIDALPIRAADVVVDLGAGLGKVVSLVARITGARVRGIEIQPALIDVAPAHVRSELTLGDARSAPLDDATVVLLYCPFEGAVTASVAARLDVGHAVVCAFGIDLPMHRLRPRPAEDFWLTVWEPPEIAP